MQQKRPEFNVLVWLISLIFFWVTLFFLQRQVFLLFHLGEIRLLPWKEVMLSNWYALPMDICAAAYLALIPFLITCVMLYARNQVQSMTTTHIINVILLAISTLITCIDTGLSLQWGTRITKMALSFVDTSPEFTSLIFTSSNAWLFVTFVIMLSISILFYLFLFKRKTLNIKSHIRFSAVVILSLGLLLLAVRGGWGKFPLDRSRVYYSVHSVLNNAAMNGDWNLTDILIQPGAKNNPYRCFENEKAEDVYKHLYFNRSDTASPILTMQRPNMVLIIMESMCADVFSCLNGEKGIAPVLDSLAAEGLLFTNIYAAGSRTDQGILALFSGYPALPQQSIIRDFAKIERLPHLNRVLNDVGYHTSYIIGGNLDYANTRGYMLSGNTGLLVDGNDFIVSRKTSWGAYDEDLFNEHLKLADAMPQPFFSAVSTITNHEEFEGDVPRIWPGKYTINRFRNTAHYADQCIGKYLKEASSRPWFKNTLFVIVADHAHAYPRKRKYNEPGKFHIPLIMYGDVLKKEFRGKKETHLGSQYDIPFTLLKQLHLNSDDFTWGKDLLNHGSKQFAWYSFDHGFGYLTESGYIVYDYNLKQTVMQEYSAGSPEFQLLTDEGKAFMQYFYSDYLGLETRVKKSR